MCFGGGAPKAPTIKYEGPSDSEIRANERALEQYRSDMATQQSAFESQLQAQIDSANAETARLQEQYATDLDSAKASAATATSDAQAAASAAVTEAGAMANLQQVGAYKVGASETEPVAAQTTAAVKKKEKPKSTLKISTAALPSSAGTGLNIGV